MSVVDIIAANTTIGFGETEADGVLTNTITGDLIFNPHQCDLYLVTDEGSEDISTDLPQYHRPPAPGCVFIKSWPHAHLAGNLVAAGLVELVDTFTIPGPTTTGLPVSEVRVITSDRPLI